MAPDIRRLLKRWLCGYSASIIGRPYWEDDKGQKMNIKIVLETGEDGYFVAHVPALKSCWSQGKTREEALQNIR